MRRVREWLEHKFNPLHILAKVLWGVMLYDLVYGKITRKRHMTAKQMHERIRSIRRKMLNNDNNK